MMDTINHVGLSASAQGMVRRLFFKTFWCLAYGWVALDDSRHLVSAPLGHSYKSAESMQCHLFHEVQFIHCLSPRQPVLRT